MPTLRHLIITLLLVILSAGCSNTESEDAFVEAIELNELNIASLSIEIDSGNSTFAADSTETARAIAQRNNGLADIDVTDRVRWSSSDSSVLTINQQGQISAKAGADSLVDIHANWADLSAVIQVAVSTEDLDSISISGDSVLPVCQGDFVLSATGTYAVGDERNISHLVSWASSDTGLVTVSADGVMSALASGNTGNIEASYDGITGVLAVEVLDNLDAITITPNTNVEVIVGQTLQFTAIGSYSDATADADITQFSTWFSDNDTLLSFDNSGDNRGLASGLAEGNTLIRASCNPSNAAVSSDVSVSVENPSGISRIEIRYGNDTEIPIQEPNDQNVQLSALLIYTNGDEVNVTTDDDTDWTSSPSTGTEASVNNTNDKGEVSFNAVGETEIEVAYEINNVIYRDTIILTVQ